MDLIEFVIRSPFTYMILIGGGLFLIFRRDRMVDRAIRDGAHNRDGSLMTEGKVKKGGWNPNKPTSKRPPAPKGQGKSCQM